MMDPVLVVLPRTWEPKLEASGELNKSPDRRGYYLWCGWDDGTQCTQLIPHPGKIDANRGPSSEWAKGWLGELESRVRDGTMRGRIRWAALVEILPQLLEVAFRVMPR